MSSAFLNQRPRLRRAIGYAAAYAVVLACLVPLWIANSGMLYIGRDGSLSLWLVRMYAQWGSATSLTLLNPFQGMGSMMLPMNPWWNPAAYLVAHSPESEIGLVLSYMVYHAEFTASVVLLGRCLGFSTLYGFVSSVWLTILLFPPFTYIFGLHSWIGSAPIYAHTLALGNAMASALVCLGKPATANTALRNIGRNVLLSALLLSMLVVFLAASPLYNAGMLGGCALLFGGIVLATPGIREGAWQIAALLISAGTLWALGLTDFLQGIFRMSSRFAEQANVSLFSFLELQRVPRFNTAEWEAAKEVLCAWGVLCDRFQMRYALTSSGWLHVLFILGGTLLAVRESGRLARIGAVAVALWMALIVYWTSEVFGVLRYGPVQPLYVYLPLYSLLAMMSLYPIKVLVEKVVLLAAPWPRPLTRGLQGLGCAVVVLFCVVMAARMTGKASRPVEWPKSSPLIEALRQEIALAPGRQFRGSVATILGMDQSDREGQTASASGSQDFQPLLNKVQAATGSPHALLDLWWFSIPTLEEYGQAVSLALRAYTTRLMGRPDYPVPPYFAIPMRIEPEILQLLGVRFVLTDGRISSKDAVLRGELPPGAASVLRLYELRSPNLGQVSPSEIVPGKRSDEILAAVEADPSILRRKAFAEFKPRNQLVPARSSKMTFVKGGVVITAESDGTSAVLLPLQFTNCLSIGSNGDSRTATIVRANLIHTLLIFSGNVDATVRWRYGFGRSADCRLKDANELRSLGLGRQ